MNLEQAIQSSPDFDVHAWVAQHRVGHILDPDNHRLCHRHIRVAANGLGKVGDIIALAHSSSSEWPSRANAMISLLREAFLVTPPNTMAYKLSAEVLSSLLSARIACASRTTGRRHSGSVHADLRAIAAIDHKLLDVSSVHDESNALNRYLGTLENFIKHAPTASVYDHRRFVSYTRQAIYQMPGDLENILRLQQALEMLYERTSEFSHLSEACALTNELRDRQQGIGCAALTALEKRFSDHETPMLQTDLEEWIKTHRSMFLSFKPIHASCADRLVALAHSVRPLLSNDYAIALMLSREALWITNRGVGISSRLRAVSTMIRFCSSSTSPEQSIPASVLYPELMQLVQHSHRLMSSIIDVLPADVRRRFKRAPHTPQHAKSILQASTTYDSISEMEEDNIPLIRWANPWRAEQIDLALPADQQEDLEHHYKSLAVDRMVIDRMSPTSPEKAHALNVKAKSILAENIPRQYDDAVSLARDSAACFGLGTVSRDTPIPLRHVVRSSLYTLCHALYMRYQSFGSVQDIEEMVCIGRQCRAPVSNDMERFLWSPGLGMALNARFERFGHTQDIIESIGYYRDFLTNAPDIPGMKMAIIPNFGAALLLFYSEKGGVHLLDEAASALRQGLQVVPLSHPCYAQYLSILGSVLHKRYIHLRTPSDLRAARDLGRAAVGIASEAARGDQLLPRYLSSLAETMLQFHIDGLSSRPLKAAVDMLQNVLDTRKLYEGHPDLPRAHVRLAAALRIQNSSHSDASDDTDLRTSIELCRQALTLQPDPSHTQYAVWSFELSRGLLDLKESEAFDEAVTWAEVSLECLAKEHPLRADIAAGLAECYYSRFLLRPEAKSDLDNCCMMYAEAAASTSSPDHRILAHTRTWINVASKHSHPSLGDAFEKSMHHHSQIVSIHRTIQERHDLLVQNPMDCAEAAAHAIAQGMFERAVMLLEHGRSVVWQQTLRLHGSIDDLQKAAPRLASQLSAVVSELDNVTRAQSAHYQGGDSWAITDPDRTRRYHRELAARYESILLEVKNFFIFSMPLLIFPAYL